MLADPTTADELTHNLSLYRDLYEHVPATIVVDQHPEYFSSKLGKHDADQLDLPLIEVQHHHAHIASCMAENAWPTDGGDVLGIALKSTIVALLVIVAFTIAAISIVGIIVFKEVVPPGNVKS